MPGNSNYPEIFYWKSNYAHPGVDDKRAIENFVECETREKIQSLRAQLYAVANGKYDDAMFIKFLGPDRKSRHNSYAEWAKVMLQWLGAYKAS